jgi:hypothetical protein
MEQEELMITSHMYQLSTLESDLKLNEEFIPLPVAKPHRQLTS